jgi:predicted permease
MGQLVLESVLLAVAGGALGVLLSLWLTGYGAALLPERLALPANDYAQLAVFSDLALDGRVVGFAALLSVAAGLVFGLGPALLVTRATDGRAGERILRAAPGGDDVVGGGRNGRIGRMSRIGTRPFSALVVGEVALALTLLVGAALLLETLGHLSARPGAERPEQVLTFRIEPSLAQVASANGPRLLEAILDRVSAVPGVRSATVGPCAPGTAGCAWREVRPPGLDEDAEAYEVRRHYVGPEHFETLGISLLRGRSLAPTDRPGHPAVTVINRHAAEALWPGEDPIGRRIVLGEGEFLDGATEATVVGVVEDVPYGAPGEAIGLDLYTSYLQFSRQFTTVMVRSAGVSPEALLPDLRRAVAAVDPDLPLYDVATLDERTGRLLTGHRFRTGLLTLFAGLALLLAAVGIYGVMSQLVARRTREMAVRVALGARPGQVMRLVVRRSLVMALTGVALGALGAAGLSRVLSSQLFGVEATDPWVFATAAGLLLAAGVLAALLPARRATRVDPMRLLRVE